MFASSLFCFICSVVSFAWAEAAFACSFAAWTSRLFCRIWNATKIAPMMTAMELRRETSEVSELVEICNRGIKEDFLHTALMREERQW